MEKTKNPYFAFIAGGIAGVSIDLTLHPLDYIKTRQHGGQKLDAFFLSYYKGITASLTASFPCAATFWGIYMLTKQYSIKSGLSLPTVESISSIVGSFACCVVRNPFERLKQLAQAGEKETIRSSMSKMIKEHGYSGLYKGFSALCIREVPFDTIQMLIFQWFCYIELLDFGKLNEFIYGGIAGGLTGYFTAPIDLTKTRIMTKPLKYPSFLKSIKIIYEEEGFKAFWKGWVTRVTYISLGGMIYFGVFNWVYKLQTT